MKKHIASILLLASSLLLAGCGDNPASNAASSVAASSSAASSKASSSVSSVESERDKFIALLDKMDAKTSAADFTYPKTFTEKLTRTSGTTSNAVVYEKSIDISGDEYYASSKTTDSAGTVTASSFSYIKKEDTAYVVYNVVAVSSKDDNKTYTSTSYTTLAEAQTALADSSSTAFSTAKVSYDKYKKNTFYGTIGYMFSKIDSATVTSETYSGSLETGNISGETVFANALGGAKYKITASSFLPSLLVLREYGSVDIPHDAELTWTAVEHTYPDLSGMTKK
jgi:hypothetical protein